MHRAAVFMPLFLLASTALAHEAKPRTITTSGTAVIFVVPDEADLRFSVHTEDADLAKAKAANDDAANEVIAYLKTQGVEAKDLQASFVQSAAIYEPRRDDGRLIRGPITGYTVTRQYSVKLRDVSKLGPIYDKLLPDARVRLEGHSLATTESRKHRDTARTNAAKAAQEKAALLAAAFGGKVGAPREITESSPEVMPMYRMQNSMAISGGGGRGDGEDLSPIGQIEVRAEVSVTFDLVPAAAE